MGGCLSGPVQILVCLGGAPCQVGTGLVKLASLSSKSDCNLFGCMKSSGYSFGCCIPVSSLQYQLIGKLLGGSNPIGEISDHLNKVGDTFWFFSGGK